MGLLAHQTMNPDPQIPPNSAQNEPQTPVVPPVTPEEAPLELPGHPANPELPAHPEPTLIPEHAEVGTPPGRPPLQSIIVGLLFLGLSLGSVFAVAQTLVDRAPAPAETQVASAKKAYDLGAFDGVVLEAKSAYVLDATDGTVLFEKDPTAQRPLASITKVALALSTAEVLDLSETVTISRSAVAEGGGGLTWGEMWKVGDLIDFTLIASSNTGAVALAEAADDELRAKYPDAPEGRATIWRMNNLAQALGLDETYFLNASGLDESATQAGAMGSARDVAELLEYAIKYDRGLFASTARPRMHLSALNITGRDVDNTNNALDAIPNLIMGKTGYTDLAGGNLGIVFEPLPDHPVIVVVLGSSYDGRFADIKKLVEASQIAISPRD